MWNWILPIYISLSPSQYLVLSSMSFFLAIFFLFAISSRHSAMSSRQIFSELKSSSTPNFLLKQVQQYYMPYDMQTLLKLLQFGFSL